MRTSRMPRVLKPCDAMNKKCCEAPLWAMRPLQLHPEHRPQLRQPAIHLEQRPRLIPSVVQVEQQEQVNRRQVRQFLQHRLILLVIRSVGHQRQCRHPCPLHLVQRRPIRSVVLQIQLHQLRSIRLEVHPLLPHPCRCLPRIHLAALLLPQLPLRPPRCQLRPIPLVLLRLLRPLIHSARVRHPLLLLPPRPLLAASRPLVRCSALSLRRFPVKPAHLVLALPR